jgi:large subunit ribosomal protein L1
MLFGVVVCTHALVASVAVGRSALVTPMHSRAARMPRAELSLKLSKRMAVAEKLVEADKVYDPTEAVMIMKKAGSVKFVETAEAHIRLNIDPKYNDQQIRTTVALPKGTGKSVRVAVLAEGAQAEAAKAAGADTVGWEDLVESISKGNLDFDVLIATPPAMPKIAKLGRVLGPKGLMPAPKVRRGRRSAERVR